MSRTGPIPEPVSCRSHHRSAVSTVPRFAASRRFALCIAVLVATTWSVVSPPAVQAQPAGNDTLEKRVGKAIDQAKRFLSKAQQPDGSWQGVNSERYRVGVTSLAVLALINAGMTPEDQEIKRGLAYLRGLPRKDQPTLTYEVSLMVMALAAAKDGRVDAGRLLSLVKQLEDSQVRGGNGAGSWGYGLNAHLPVESRTDRSNGQFAVLALREAQDAGIPVSLQTWKRARNHWKLHQSADGGWSYSGDSEHSTGSMTVAGIVTMVITEAMVRAEDNDLNPDGTPNCCGERVPDKAIDDGVRWLGKHFATGHNPGAPNSWVLYYLYGLERAGRLSGLRFFGEGDRRHDWYREGAEFLVSQQSQVSGNWRGLGPGESDPVVGTCFALLFLSKGLAPVLINKLEYGPRDARGDITSNADWNRHPYDVRNLTHLISGLPKWPKLVTWQVVDVSRADVSDLLQAPVLHMSGTERPEFSDREVELLKEFVAQGGFIYAERCCKSASFDEGFRDLIKRMYPQSEARLKMLPADHALYRSEYLIDPSTVEMWGVDVGCRTSIIYSPHDFSCLWDKWTPFEVPGRSPQMSAMITKAVRIGVNVVAYATGRELPNKLEQQALAIDELDQQIQRGYLEIAKIRHTGGWDAAPQALRNLLTALNKAVGLTAATKSPSLAPLDPAISKYPLLYMHGRTAFQMSRQEQDNLRTYLQRGGVLFADSCCGAAQFDSSFRKLVEQMFPDEKLKRIPADHEMFTTAIAYDVQRVRRREPDVDSPNSPLNSNVRTVEPFFEGIEIDGKFVVIYSKYDISCALERQASVACAGYVHEDAVKLAINVVLYSLLQ